MYAQEKTKALTQYLTLSSLVETATAAKDDETASLIAAAPEMLEALREAESYAELKLEGFRRDYSEDHAMVQTPLRLLATLRAAIARAEGTQRAP